MLDIKKQGDGTWAVRTAHGSEPELFHTFRDATAWVARIRRELDPSLQKWALTPKPTKNMARGLRVSDFRALGKVNTPGIFDCLTRNNVVTTTAGSRSGLTERNHND